MTWRFIDMGTGRFRLWQETDCGGGMCMCELVAESPSGEWAQIMQALAIEPPPPPKPRLVREWWSPT